METILSIVSAMLLVSLGSFALISRKNLESIFLLAALYCLAGIELFDRLSLWESLEFGDYREVSLYLEALLPLALLLVSVTNNRSKPLSSQPNGWLALTAISSIFPILILTAGSEALYFTPDIHVERILYLESWGYWYYLGMMVSFVFALVNVENTLTSTHGYARNRMKFESFGIMSILTVLIFYYGQGLLYRTININLIPLRSGIVSLGVLLIAYSRIFRGEGPKVAVSRHVFYRSITLMLVGAYLLTLGMIGEGMRYFGTDFSRNVMLALAFAAGIFLLAVLFSDNMRRRAKVYISKHFYTNKHDYRTAWIDLTNKLSSCRTSNELQEAALSEFKETFGIAGASLYLPGFESGRYRISSVLNMPDMPAELLIGEELSDYFVLKNRVLSLADDECPLPTPMHVVLKKAKMWLMVPLIINSRLEGLILLREQIIKEDLTYDDYDLMKVLARQVAHALVNFKLSEEVMEMRAMAAVSRITTFVIHDLKNLTTGLSLVADNAAEHIGNPEFQHDAIQTIRNTLAKMRDLTQRLRSIPERTAIQSRVEDIDRMCRKVIEEMTPLLPGTAQISYRGSKALSFIDRDEIRKIIVNLIQNAVEASPDGVIEMAAFAENGNACIRVSDSGIGMDDEFIKNNLFKPFNTTKDKGLGIGLYQSRQIVSAHGGRIDVMSEPGKGTTFTVVLPSMPDSSRT